MFHHTKEFFQRQVCLASPPEPSSSSWGYGGAPSSPSPGRTQRSAASRPDACCNAWPCWRDQRRMSSWLLTTTLSGDRNSLLKQGEVDQELRDVDHVLQAEVVLTSEERIGTFGLKGDVEHLVTEWQRVWRLQTFPVKEYAERRVTRGLSLLWTEDGNSQTSHTSSKASGVVPMKKPPGFSLSQAFLSIISAFCSLSNE